MILDELDAKERFESPNNLLNRLREITAPSKKSESHPSIPPKAEDLIDDLNDKLANSSLKSKAAGIMSAAMDELGRRVTEISKPETLARIASEMGKVIESQTNKNQNEDKRPQFLIYSPSVHNENHYETIQEK